MKENHKKIILFLALTILLMNNLSAFAISSAYYEEKDLEMLPGESQEIIMFLQNTHNSEIKIQAKIITGTEIIKISSASSEYIVPAKSKSTIKFLVEIPKKAKVGQIYPIKIEFSNPNKEDGNFAFGTSINQNFNVKIVEKQNPNEPTIRLIIFSSIGMFILIIGIFAFKKMKRRKVLGNFKY